jgi:hypothetical protein
MQWAPGVMVCVDGFILTHAMKSGGLLRGYRAEDVAMGSVCGTIKDTDGLPMSTEDGKT